MSTYQLILVPEMVTSEARRTRSSPGYGHPVHKDLAGGYGPCRQCLKFFEPEQDRRLLMTYDAFHQLDADPLPGPIYIHAERCDPYPTDGGIPHWLFKNPLTLLAFRHGQIPVVQARIEAGGNDSVIGDLLARPDVDYVQVRDGVAGCSTFSVTRSHDQKPG